MKYLIWLLVILVAIWAFKRNRRVASDASKNATPADSPAASQVPANMVTCVHCGIHLPQDEAVIGVNGLYCSTDHRATALDRKPD